MNKFHLVLNEIAKHIDSDTLKSMKYMCRNFIMPAKMEKIKTPLELLTVLEEDYKIFDGDVCFLIDLLKSEKPALVKKLVPFNFAANESLQESMSFSERQQPTHNAQSK